MKNTILIVDDEATQRRLLEAVVTKAGYGVEVACGGSEAIDRLLNGVGGIDAVILDLSMPVVDGIDVLQAVHPKLPYLPIVMLTSHSSVKNVVDAMQAGANDFLIKPASAERIRSAIEAALGTSAFVGEIETVGHELGAQHGFEGIVGSSPLTLETMELAKRASRSGIPVLLEGASGVGKEVFARAIAESSVRGDKPFVAVNCGAIPENLVESILFGHEKGAFTGANDKHVGKFQKADGGTLFLDEVGELPLDIQVKLLRAIQEGEIDPVGAKAPVKVDIRIISATNKNLQSRIHTEEFREDLFYRLAVFPILIPTLAERKEDIPALAKYFVERIVAMEKLEPKHLSNEAMELLMSYAWPGNIRQLQNALFRAVIMSDSQEVGVDNFLHLLGREGAQRVVAPVAMPHTPTLTPSQALGVGIDTVVLHNGEGHIRTLADVEAEQITRAVKHYDGRMSEIARRLGIGRSTLYRKLEELGLK